MQPHAAPAVSRSRRTSEITDALVDLLIRLVLKINTRAEKKVEKGSWWSYGTVRTDQPEHHVRSDFKINPVNRNGVTDTMPNTTTPQRGSASSVRREPIDH